MGQSSPPQSPLNIGGGAKSRDNSKNSKNKSLHAPVPDEERIAADGRFP
jgi:hypothetical protein